MQIGFCRTRVGICVRISLLPHLVEELPSAELSIPLLVNRHFLEICWFSFSVSPLSEHIEDYGLSVCS